MPNQQKDRKYSKSSKLLFGFAFLLVGIVLVANRSGGVKNLNNYTFADEPVSVQGFTPRKIVDREPYRIIVPELSIDLEVAKAKAINGYWEVFGDKAGWGEGSGIPGHPGNQVIFAHAQKGLFSSLKNVEEGMNIYVLSKRNETQVSEDVAEASFPQGDGWYQYEVREVKEVRPSQTEVIAPTDDETLTLYTCSGFNDNRRLIVVAKRK